MRAVRYETKEKASVEIYGKTGNFVAQVKNLSVTGACLEWIQDGAEVIKGDLLRMTVVLRALNRRHNISCEVVWTNGKTTGVNFIKSSEILEKIFDKD